jgi:hypothetical protein
MLSQNVCHLFLGGYVGLPVSDTALPHSSAG